MIYETIENGRSFSGEVYNSEAPSVIVLEGLECEAISFSKVKKELNKEFKTKFCSHRVLVEYLSNLSNEY